MIASVSGIRGIVNEDFDAGYAETIGRKFGTYIKHGALALATDTRKTSGVIKGGLVAGLLESGCTIFDLGFSSTPSVFKEVSKRNLEGGLIVTASHNPPEWNGIKFVVKGGRGVFEEELEAIQSIKPSLENSQGRIYTQRPVYLDILRESAGKDSAKGVKVSLDMAGGVGSLFVPSLLSFQGCQVHSIHDSPGIFPRIIDPTADSLEALSHLVKNADCQVGFAFDCDADRLVIVDEQGKKLSGDATLLTCLYYFLENARNRRVAVSVDTTLAAEELVKEYNGTVLYSKVGEANVVRTIIESDCGAGGEGSSGGYIEPAFAMCRDGVKASTTIVRMIKSEGSLKAITSNFKSYYQDRAKLEIDRKVAKKVLSILGRSEGEVDLTDGVKIRKGEKSWVLIRPSNTENVIRVSAEAKSIEAAHGLVNYYSAKIQEIEKEGEIQ